MDTTTEKTIVFMTQKHVYTAPEADLFVVRFEESFLLSGGEYGEPGAAGGDFIFGGGADDNIFDFGGLL